jgi:dihydrolipoamide dehydrogenase
VIGGGPGGYEAALVAAQLGARTTVVDADGLGGAAVLTDCVPSKTLIATSDVMTEVGEADRLGVVLPGRDPAGDRGSGVAVDMKAVNSRVKELARSQSADILRKMEAVGVDVMVGRGRLDSPQRVVAETDNGQHALDADAVLVATGATPRRLPSAVPDGDRILDWRQVYDLDVLPEHLIVVGSGVTGAEFAGAYLALGSEVTLVSSRDRVLPGEDADAALVLEEAFRRRGMDVRSRSRAQSVTRTADGVVVTCADGSVIEGSHCLLAVGSVPNTADMGLESAGVRTTETGHVEVDRVSRTSARGVYAAGDCTGVLALASVAAMQGRIAMRHALGDAVVPLSLKTVSSNIFTSPEIATVGWSQAEIDGGIAQGVAVTLPLSTNARAKMQGLQEGFVKLFSRTGSGTVIGGVVVAPRASELIYPITLAVEHRLTVDQVARAFTVYPSLSGTIGEAARQLHPAPLL